MEDWGELISRLLLALAAGGAIGWNRGLAGKPAGMRTHMLISMGAALFVMTSLAHGSADSESRAIQGVATGVGFLGAGEIVHRTVRGAQTPRNLTSAAAIWVAAASGAAAGARAGAARQQRRQSRNQRQQGSAPLCGWPCRPIAFATW